MVLVLNYFRSATAYLSLLTRLAKECRIGLWVSPLAPDLAGKPQQAYEQFVDTCIRLGAALIPPEGAPVEAAVMMGPATPVHQDRAFWTKKEADEPASMLTLWFALEDIGADRGALRLTRDGRTDDVATFNRNPTLYEHVRTEFSDSGNFGLAIDGPVAAAVEERLETVCPRGGDMVIFDAYEPHGSMPHTGEGARMAFKIVLGERARVESFLVRVRDLLEQPSLVTYGRLKSAHLFR